MDDRSQRRIVNDVRSTQLGVLREMVHVTIAKHGVDKDGTRK